MLFSGVVGLLAAAPLAFAASLQRVSDFGSNPNRINMYIYVPDKLAASPAIIVAVSTLFSGFFSLQTSIRIISNSGPLDAPLRR